MSALPRLSGSRTFWAVSLGLFAVRLAAAAWIPFTEDEAYYRLWSQAPALGYYDHPPMIAWWIAAGRAVLGDTALGVRILPALGNLLTARLTVAWTRAMGWEEAAAWRAGLFLNLTLLALGGGFLATPDNPATLFWVATLYCCARAERGAGLWWIGAGVFAGAACLSKYSALFIGPGVFLWLVLSPHRRVLLRTPGPWLALLCAALVFSPNIVWNAGHGWVTMIKQFGRIQPHHLTLLGPALFLGAQAMLLNPALVWGAGRTLRSRAVLLTDLAVIAVAPFALYLVIHAMHDRVEAHWAAPLHPVVAVLAARAAPRVWAVLITPAAAIGALLISLAVSPAELGGLDPLRGLRGWTGLSRQISELRPAWVGTNSYGLAARLSAPPGVGAPAVQIAERIRYLGLRNQPVDLSRPGLFVDLVRRIDVQRLKACFGTVQPLGVIHRAGIHARNTDYGVYRVGEPRKDISRDGCW